MNVFLANFKVEIILQCYTYWKVLGSKPLFIFCTLITKVIVLAVVLRRFHWHKLLPSLCLRSNKQLLDEVEQNIVICLWRADQLFADAEARGK